jgi:acetylglutamate kinase
VTRVVVKLGGHALDSLDAASPVLVGLAQDINTLREANAQVLVVHGGGPQIAELLERVGVPSVFDDGLRVTDDETMAFVSMALQHVNVQITAALNHAGVNAVGLTGADSSLLVSSVRGERWGRAGTTPRVNVEPVEALWREGSTPVVCPLAVDGAGRLLNVNADTAAGALAGALGADTLILLSDVDQLRANPDDPSSALTQVSAAQVRSMLQSGAAREGMIPKVGAALDALDAGARRVVLANGSRPHATRDVLAGALPTTEMTT